jgi:hypothetical protein
MTPGVSLKMGVTNEEGPEYNLVDGKFVSNECEEAGVIFAIHHTKYIMQEERTVTGALRFMYIHHVGKHLQPDCGRSL